MARHCQPSETSFSNRPTVQLPAEWTATPSRRWRVLVQTGPWRSGNSRPPANGSAALAWEAYAAGAELSRGTAGIPFARLKPLLGALAVSDPFLFLARIRCINFFRRPLQAYAIGWQPRLQGGAAAGEAGMRTGGFCPTCSMRHRLTWQKLSKEYAGSCQQVRSCRENGQAPRGGRAGRTGWLRASATLP